MNKSDLPIRKFNPGTFQSDEEVIEQFVVRKHELDIVLEVLRGNIDSPSCQHVLVVAPRGRGKTMLLTRVAAELNTNHELSESLLPVRFMEESHEIFSLADFWLDTLFYLARDSTKHDPVLAEELRKTHTDLTNRWHEERLADRARAAVLEAADRLGRKLVLMVENLQALCGNVDKHFGWKLRGSLQSEPQIMLLATATSRFEGLDDAEQPFFELFRIIALEPLATEECRRLWQVVSGDAVSQREIRPLEILTGGSPRLLVIVAEFARHRSLRQLMEKLVELIDDHTEYFRGHLEVLAKGERRVYIAVIDLWQPSSTGEVAARARMDVRPVSALLGRLVERGAVIAEGSGKKRRYAAAERLYSIYYKLRRERDEAAVVANLIRFMAVFYSNTELAEMSGKLIAEATRLPTIREGIERAIAEQPQLGHLFPSMARPSIDWTSSPAAETDNESFKQLFEEITTVFNEGAFEKVIETEDQAFTAESANWSRIPSSLIALALIQAPAHEQRGKFKAAIEVCDKSISRFGSSNEPQLLDYNAIRDNLTGRMQGSRVEIE
ncbi:MAG: ATP-binding protein [Gemmatimonadetes bacterium]|nr:ATP-binding protein [Gemmatimonadota bacterium]